MEPIKRIRLSDSVLEAVKKMIEEDRFRPGDRFYSENELAGKLQVSRSSIREAIRILEASGRVTVRQGKGIFIVSAEEEKMESFSAWLRDNEASIADHFEVRLIIEPKAARRAAEKADGEDVAHMEQAHRNFIRDMEKDDISGLIGWDEEFHRLVAKSTKNRTLYFLMRTMTHSLHEGWISSLTIPGRSARTVAEHGEVLSAIRGKDPDRAERGMSVHLGNALDDIRSSMSG